MENVRKKKKAKRKRKMSHVGVARGEKAVRVLWECSRIPLKENQILYSITLSPCKVHHYYH